MNEVPISSGKGQHWMPVRGHNEAEVQTTPAIPRTYPNKAAVFPHFYTRQNTSGASKRWMPHAFIVAHLGKEVKASHNGWCHSEWLKCRHVEKCYLAGSTEFTCDHYSKSATKKKRCLIPQFEAPTARIIKSRLGNKNNFSGRDVVPICK